MAYVYTIGTLNISLYYLQYQFSNTTLTNNASLSGSGKLLDPSWLTTNTNFGGYIMQDMLRSNIPTAVWDATNLWVTVTDTNTLPYKPAGSYAYTFFRSGPNVSSSFATQSANQSSNTLNDTISQGISDKTYYYKIQIRYPDSHKTQQSDLISVVVPHT